MREITQLLFPTGHPNTFLLTVGQCFAWSGVAAVSVAIVFRFAWRAGKKMGDL